MMDCKAFKENISEFLDSELEGPESTLAQAHLAECRECRGAFAELQGLSRMLKSLPQQPLPLGFMERLERHRQAEIKPSSPAGWALFGKPAPLAALALSSLIVIFIDYDKARAPLKLQPQEILSGTALNFSPANQPSRQLARAKGAPFAPASAPAKLNQSYTNEELSLDIESQKKRMGIRRITPPGRLAERAGVLATLGASSGAGYGAQRLEAKPSLPLLAGDTPAVVSRDSSLQGKAVTRRDNTLKAKKAQFDEATGVVVYTEAERQDLWRKHQIKIAAPKIDYSSQMLAVVFARPRTTIVITRVAPEPDRLVIEYHELPFPASSTTDTLSASCQFRVIPKTDKPIIFEKIP